jgi:hypothetical protein
VEVVAGVRPAVGPCDGVVLVGPGGGHAAARPGAHAAADLDIAS